MGTGGRRKSSYKSFGDTAEFTNVYAKVADKAIGDESSGDKESAVITKVAEPAEVTVENTDVPQISDDTADSTQKISTEPDSDKIADIIAPTSEITVNTEASSDTEPSAPENEIEVSATVPVIIGEPEVPSEVPDFLSDEDKKDDETSEMVVQTVQAVQEETTTETTISTEPEEPKAQDDAVLSETAVEEEVTATAVPEAETSEVVDQIIQTVQEDTTTETAPSTEPEEPKAQDDAVLSETAAEEEITATAVPEVETSEMVDQTVQEDTTTETTISTEPDEPKAQDDAVLTETAVEEEVTATAEPGADTIEIITKTDKEDEIDTLEVPVKEEPAPEPPVEEPRRKQLKKAADTILMDMDISVKAPETPVPAESFAPVADENPINIKAPETILMGFAGMEQIPEESPMPEKIVSGGHSGEWEDETISTITVPSPEKDLKSDEPEISDEESDETPEESEVEPVSVQVSETPKDHWTAGSVINNLFVVEKLLGAGNTGKTHQVMHSRWKIPLAAKVIGGVWASTSERREALTEACQEWINCGCHPNLLSCHYAINMDTCVAIIHQLDSSRTLKQIVKDEGAIGWRKTVDLGAQCLDGLDCLHQQGTIHGNLKSSSIFIDSDDVLKLGDPGIIRGLLGTDPTGDDVRVNPEDTVCLSNGFAGTPSYMAPEFWNGEVDKIGPWSDIYSLGVLMYEMLCGKRPFDEGTASLKEIGKAHLEVNPPSPTSINGEIPGRLSDFILTCLSKDCRKRPATYGEAREKLSSVYADITGKLFPRQVPQKDRYRADALNNRALSLSDLGRNEEAISLWEEAVRIKPGHMNATYNLNLFKWRQGLISDVALVKTIVELIDSDPGHWFPRYLLGIVQAERCDNNAALKTLKKIRGSDSERPQVMEALSYAEGDINNSRRLVKTFKGHSAPVFSVRFSGDGGTFLSGSMDKTIKLWDVESGKCLKTLEGHNGYVNCVDMSPDGKFAISGGGELISEDYDLKYWDLENGKEIHTLEGHKGLVRAVALSPDGTLAVSGGTDNALKIWDVKEGRCIHTLEGHDEWVNSVAFSPDGQYVVSGSGTPRGNSDRTLRLWDVNSGTCIRKIEGHTASINSVCFSTDGQFIMSGSGNPGEKEDNTVRLWQAASGLCIRKLSEHAGRINSVSMGPLGRYAVSGGEDKTLKLWNIETGQCIRTFLGIKGEVNTISLDATGRHAVTGGADSHIQLWEVSCGRETFLARHQVSDIRADKIDVSEDESYEKGISRARQAIAFQDYPAAAHWLREARSQKGKQRDPKVMARWIELYSKLRRKEPKDGWEMRRFDGHSGQVTGAYLIEKTGTVISTGSDNCIMMWDLESGQPVRTFGQVVQNEGGIASFSVTGNGEMILTGGASAGSFRLFSTETGELVRTFDSFKEAGRLTVRITADGRLAFCASDKNHLLNLFETATGRLLRQYDCHKGGISDFVISRDLHYILTAGADNSIKLWDMAGGRCLRTLKGRKLKGVHALAISDNGRFALSGSADKSIRLWETDTGKCIYIISELEHDVTSLFMSSDAHYALTNYGNTVKMWDLTTGQIMLTLEGHTDKVNNLFLSCDGRLALSAGADGTLRHWILDWNLEDKKLAEWDENARAYLETFLELHTPFAEEIPEGKKINDKKLQAALSRKGKARFSEEDFRDLLHYLGCVGYGWLRAESIRRELDKMSEESRDSWLNKVFSIFTKEV